MAPVLLGIDVSRHQGTINWSAMKHAGVVFAGIKATEGDGWTDPYFARNLAECRRVGIIPFAYHYQRSTATAAEQVARIRRVVPRTCAVVPDVEAASGSVAITRGIVAGLRRANYLVPLSYIPRWYWQQIGRPTLSGLPPLWSSRYPDNAISDLSAEYAQVTRSFMHFWDGYGGLPVRMLQFTSSARVGGRAPIDGDAVRMGMTELRRMLVPGYAPTTPGDDMPDLHDLLNTKVGTNAYDELSEYATKNGTFGHFLLNQRQDNDRIRELVEKLARKEGLIE